MKTLHIACDHAGFSLKTHLTPYIESMGYTVVDHGTSGEESCDYPIFAHKLCHAVTLENGLGILMAANRHPHIRAALCTTELHARLSREHNNTNVLCLGARMTGVELAKAIVAAFLCAAFAEGRHARRVSQLTPCENSE